MSLICLIVSISNCINSLNSSKQISTYLYLKIASLLNSINSSDLSSALFLNKEIHIIKKGLSMSQIADVRFSSTIPTLETKTKRNSTELLKDNKDENEKDALSYRLL